MRLACFPTFQFQNGGYMRIHIFGLFAELVVEYDDDNDRIFHGCIIIRFRADLKKEFPSYFDAR